MKTDKLKIEYKPLSDLIPYINNAKLHPDKQIGKIASSIKEFGFVVPILLDADNGVIAGHGRIEAAKKLKMKEVPCVYLGDLTPAQVRGLRIAENQLTMSSSWDFEMLGAEIDGLKDLDFDLDVLGFEDLDFGLNEIDYGKEWAGMPEFENEDKTAFRTIHVHFATQAHVDEFSKLMGQAITEKTRFIWHPESVIEKQQDKKYE